MAGLKDAIASDILPLVAKTAPLLGSVLGSPLAGVGISLLAKAFGVSSGNLSDLLNAISTDPQSAFKIRQLELEHQEVLEQIAAQDYQTEVDDRKDARNHSAQYKDFLRHMAYVVTIGFFGVLSLMFIPLQVSETDKQLLSMLVGMLVSKWQTIMDFFYGSSRHKQDVFNQGGLGNGRD